MSAFLGPRQDSRVLALEHEELGTGAVSDCRRAFFLGDVHPNIHALEDFAIEIQEGGPGSIPQVQLATDVPGGHECPIRQSRFLQDGCHAPK